MNLEEVQDLRSKVKEMQKFNWEDATLCIVSNLHSKVGLTKDFLTYTAEKTLAQALGINFKDFRRLTYALYDIKHERKNYRNKCGRWFIENNFRYMRNLKKSAALRLLDRAIELGKIPNKKEFHFVTDDFI